MEIEGDTVVFKSVSEEEETKMKYIEMEDRPYREVVEDLLQRRSIKNRLGMLVWLRNQKELKVTANMKRVETARKQIEILLQMIDEEKEGTLEAEDEYLGDELI